MNRPKKILVIRNDKIGDFMLAWPSFALLKKQYPDVEITALVPEYTAELAELCEWIDHVLIDKRQRSFVRDIVNLKRSIKAGRFDASISLFSQGRTALALWLAGVKQRIGPATKIAQIFLNRRLRQRRSESAKPEYEYNLDLIRYYIYLNHDKPVEVPPPPYLKFPTEEILALRRSIKEKYEIPETSRIIIIHPGTGGSAINLSTDQYAELAGRLSESGSVFFLVTAGPGELSVAAELSDRLQDTDHALFESKAGIVDFCKIINTADLFISGSTGPLHIAGALNINTVAFYPSKRSASPVRWRTINDENRRLAFTDAGNHQKENLDIDLKLAAEKVQQLLSRHQDGHVISN